MKKFEDFIKEKIVTRVTPNIKRANSLILESNDKKNFLELSLKSIPKNKMNSNFVVNYCYDILIELIRAKMYLDGFNANGSHEAEISYLKLLNFSNAEITFMDEIRYYRNGTKYYGTILETYYSKKVLIFMNKIYPKLKGFLKYI
jgi:hypothetical protein